MTYKVMAYVADWSFSKQLTPEQAALLTHVNYAFGSIKQGCVSVAHLEQLDRLSALQKAYPHLKVNLSVGGWGADGFSQAVSTQETRETLACSAIQVIRQMNLTGIDWDWEYPTTGEADIAFSKDDDQHMTEFLCLMRRKLDALQTETGRYYEQSIAVGGSRTKDYLWEAAVPALDSVNLMTYDMGMGEKVGHVTNLFPSINASYSAQQSVKNFFAAGVPKEKLCIGAAFYYHVYQGASVDSPLLSVYEKKGHAVAHDALDAGQYTPLWDEEAQAMCYQQGDVLLSGDDERSLTAKSRYIVAQSLGGVIIWELNHDQKNALLPYLAGQRVR